MRPREQAAVDGIGCPTCKARKGVMCKRLSASSTPWHWSDEHGDTVRITYLPGEPCKVPHLDRVYALERAKNRTAFNAMNEERRRATMLSAELTAAAAAVRSFDRAEHDQLKAWLRENWRVLVA